MRLRGAGTVASIAAVAGTVAFVPATQGGARIRCSSGPVVVLDGRLKIFAIPNRNPYGSDTAGLYACLGHRRPVAIGSDATRIATFDGARYVATLDISLGGEGSGDASYSVVDLNARRAVTFAGAVGGEDGILDGLRPFRVTGAGALVRDDYGIQVIRRGFRGDDRLIPPVGSGYEIAYAGRTAYWTDRSDPVEIAHSAVVNAPANASENRVYDLQRLDVPALLRPRRGPCATQPGVIIAASVHVRVVARRTHRRYACALGKSWRRALGPRTGAKGELRIVGDRWLLSRTATGAQVIDARNGKVVTKLAGLTGETAIEAATLVGNGTLAWLEHSGRLLAQRPGAPESVVLAEASAGPTTLASSDGTVYWTAGGAPQAWPLAR